MRFFLFGHMLPQAAERAARLFLIVNNIAPVPSKTGPEQDDNRKITGEEQERFPVFSGREYFYINELNHCRRLYLTGASLRMRGRGFVRSRRVVPQLVGSVEKSPATLHPPATQAVGWLD
ncbi:MAG TPA: hypothetical protein VGD08_24150 [Stellaceae bacterium]